MSLQFIRHSVYTRGLKNFKNRNIPDAWKSSAAATAAGIVHKPTMRVPCGVKHTALGGFWPKIWLSVWFALYI